MTDTPSLPLLREAVAKMTEGPWHAGSVGPYPYTANVYGNPKTALGIVAQCYRCPDAYTPHRSDVTQGDMDAAGIVALRNAADAMLDEVEAERIENAHLREAFVTMEKAYNVEHRRHSDLLGLLSEFYPAEADIRECLTRSRADLAAAKAHAEDSQDVDEMEADLAAARAVLDTILEVGHDDDHPAVMALLDRAAWQAWQERGRG